MLKTSITDFLKDMTIPPICAVCGKLSAENVCRQCTSKIIPLSSIASCYHCGRPLQDVNNDLCNLCRTEEYHFKAHRSYAKYSGDMKKIIKKFKYKKIYNLKDVLTEFLSNVYEMYFSGSNIDYVDTVPGEHTDILVDNFSKRYRIPFKANIIRIRQPEKQGSLGLAERKVNVLDCFKLRDCLAYKNKNILLIDDVWTTGSTLKEICRMLRSNGVKASYLLTLARGA